jgi:hypothetical protein
MAKKEHDEISFTFDHQDLERIFNQECEVPDGFMFSHIRKCTGNTLTVHYFQSDIDDEE